MTSRCSELCLHTLKAYIQGVWGEGGGEGVEVKEWRWRSGGGGVEKGEKEKRKERCQGREWCQGRERCKGERCQGGEWWSVAMEECLHGACRGTFARLPSRNAGAPILQEPAVTRAAVIGPHGPHQTHNEPAAHCVWRHPIQPWKAGKSRSQWTLGARKMGRGVRNGPKVLPCVTAPAPPHGQRKGFHAFSRAPKTCPAPENTVMRSVPAGGTTWTTPTPAHWCGPRFAGAIPASSPAVVAVLCGLEIGACFRPFPLDTLLFPPQ